MRPFFPFDPTTPAETPAGASRAVTSPQWLVAHDLALIGFVLLLCVLPALTPASRQRVPNPAPGSGTLLSGVGVALILPTLGAELDALPAIGRLFLDSNAAVAPLVGSIDLGGATLVTVLGLLLLAVGAIMLATAIARSQSLPMWAGITFRPVSPFWCPFFPPAVRVADGLLIGIGGIGLACTLRRAA